MKIAKDIWADLIEKRLWPLALLGVVLVAVVPMMLSRPGDPTVAPAIPNLNAGSAAAGPELTLTRATNTGFAMAPHVNRKQLDPFADRNDSAAKRMVKSLNDQLNSVIGNGGTTSSSTGGTVPDTSGGSGGGGGGGGGGSTKPTPTPKPTTPETESDDVLSLLVQDSATPDAPQELDDIRTLSPLVDPAQPFLVYVGKAGTDAASFLVSSDVTLAPTSGGTCAPSLADCRTLTMKVGDTATFALPAVGETAAHTVDVTVVDVTTKKVPVAGDEDTATAARLEAKARVVGAKTLKRAITDPAIVKSLVKNRVKIRH